MSSFVRDERRLGRDDSLEYFIKFPPSSAVPTPSNGHLPSAAVELACTDEHVPIVLLLGWAGCQDRYLMKYSKIYEDRG